MSQRPQRCHRVSAICVVVVLWKARWLICRDKQRTDSYYYSRLLLLLLGQIIIIIKYYYDYYYIRFAEREEKIKLRITHSPFARRS